MDINGIKIIPCYDGDKIVSVTIVTEDPGVTVYHHCKGRNNEFIKKLKDYSFVAVQGKNGDLVGFDIKTKKPHERFVCRKMSNKRSWLRLIPTKDQICITGEMNGLKNTGHNCTKPQIG